MSDVLIDRLEIADLVSRLGVVLDEGRFTEMPELFVENATARTPGGVAQGRDAVVAQAERNHGPDLNVQHVITNVLVDLDGDRAHVRCQPRRQLRPGRPRRHRAARAVHGRSGVRLRRRAHTRGLALRRRRHHPRLDVRHPPRPALAAKPIA